jgi:aminoglycoside 2'-N-acetyltransferase I
VVVVQVVATGGLFEADLRAIRHLLNEAFTGSFSEDDWNHALGGWHAMVRSGDLPIAHAAAVERRIIVGDEVFRAGYVEAVAVAAGHRRRGLGTAVMSRVTDLIRAQFELGALSTSRWPFYARLGWERWHGPTCVRTADGGVMRSEEEDDSVMILRCARSSNISVTDPISCDLRAGDSW